MKKRVLVFPCGSEIGLEIHRSLRFSKEFELVGGSSVSDHGEYVYENYIHNIPSVDDEDFIRSIEQVVTDNDIDFIFPAHDSVVLRLAQNVNKINATIITSSKETCEIARSKSLTYKKLSTVVKVPSIYESLDDIEYNTMSKGWSR